MDIEDLEKKAKEIEAKSDFIVSWKALKYNKTIFRVGNMSKSGCRTWEQGGKKYMTFWDRDRERYTTANSEIVSITFNIFQKGAK